MTEPRSPASLDDILTHSGWVRNLARSLVRDQSTGDDLSQEALIAALRSPPRDGLRIRSWFRRVLKNLRSNRRREDARRTRRELAAGRAEAESSADALVARAEEHRRVVQSVLELPSPFRETVLLRYFEELTPARIAARTGVPSSTVRSRLTRALGKLRERLDEEHGSDGRAWKSAILPLALVRLAPPTATVGAAALGVLIMGTKAKLTLLCLVILALAAGLSSTWIWWKGGGPEAPDVVDRDGVAADRAPAGGDSLDERVAGGASPGANPGTGSDVKSGEKGHAGVVYEVDVEVVGPDGRPVADALVRIDDHLRLFDPAGNPILPAGGPGDGGTESTAWARTDASGRARLRHRGNPVAKVHAVWGGHAAISKALILDASRAGRARLQFVEAGTLTGRILSADGSPIEGGWVLLWADREPWEELLRTRSAYDGSFSIEGIPLCDLERGAGVTARAQGYLRATRAVGGQTPLPETLEFVLRPELVVEGRCVDESGRPLPGVQIRCKETSGKWKTRIDGCFELRELPRSGVRLGLEVEALAPRGVQVAAQSTGFKDVGDIVMRGGEVLRIRVVLPDGTAVPNAILRLSDSEALVVRRARADSLGEFEFLDLADREYVLSARRPGGDPATDPQAGMVVKPGESPVRVVLSGARSVLFELVSDSDGKPVSADEVVVSLAPESDPATFITRTFRGKDLQSVRVTMAKPGRYRVSVAVPGYERYTAEGVEFRSTGGEGRVDVRLRKADR